MTSLLRMVEGWADALFVRCSDSDTSYREAAKRISLFKNECVSVGVRDGDVVLVECSQPETTIVALLAVLDLGAHVFPINTRWPELMVVDAKRRTGARFSIRQKLGGQLEVLPEAGVAGNRHLTTCAPSVIVATSGSTGTPKFAVLPLTALLASARGVNEFLSLQSVDCWQLSLPLFHVGGLGVLFRSLLAGSSVALLQTGGTLSPEIARHVSFLSLVPTQLYRLLREERSREYVKQQRCILLGGAPIGADLCRRAQECRLSVVPSYGLTEMGSLVTAASRISIADGNAVSMGQAAGSREIAVAPSGEILVRGECLFAGYLTEEGVVRELSDGWFRTGDIGSCDSAGSLYVMGRVDSQFISGGENLHPEMIEQALTAIAPIVAACVVPLDDPEFGQRPFALVVTDGASFDPTSVCSELRSRIPGFAIPTEIVEAPHDIVTGSGKIARKKAMEYAMAYSRARSRQ